jgi:alcohol dehydrogenase (cytochrome c)
LIIAGALGVTGAVAPGHHTSTGTKRCWSQKIRGAIGCGVITYTANGAQRVAVATGFTSILWPTEVVTAKIVILGLDNVSASQ